MEKDAEMWYKMGSILPCGHKIDYTQRDSVQLVQKDLLKGLFFCPSCNKKTWLPCISNLQLYKPPEEKNEVDFERLSQRNDSGRRISQGGSMNQQGYRRQSYNAETSEKSLPEKHRTAKDQKTTKQTEKGKEEPNEAAETLKPQKEEPQEETEETPITWTAPSVEHLLREPPTEEEVDKHEEIKDTLSFEQKDATEQLQTVLETSGAAFILCDEEESNNDFQDVLNYMMSDYAQQGEDDFRMRRNRAVPVLRLCRADFDSELDFKYPSDKGSIETVGGFNYHQPSNEWFRVGLKVRGRYENDDWMGSSGEPGEWVVAYHGSKSLSGNQSIAENQEIRTTGARQLHQDDLDINPMSTRHKMTCGPGAYFACNIDIASGYAKERMGEKCVFEVRLNPKEMRVPERETGYAIVNDAKNARPIGICILSKKKDGCHFM